MIIPTNKTQNKVKPWRENKGLTQKELAAEAGISERNIQSIEAGSDPRVSTIIRILKVLNVKFEQLYPGSLREQASQEQKIS